MSGTGVGGLQDKREALVPRNIQDDAAREGLLYHTIPT